MPQARKPSSFPPSVSRGAHRSRAHRDGRRPRLLGSPSPYGQPDGRDGGSIRFSPVQIATPEINTKPRARSRLSRPPAFLHVSFRRPAQSRCSAADSTSHCLIRPYDRTSVSPERSPITGRTTRMRIAQCVCTLTCRAAPFAARKTGYATRAEMPAKPILTV